VLILLHGDDQSCSNEATPIRVPRIVDVRGIDWRANVWLFWIFLVITVPGTQ
jgi:hypothetical protein